MPDQRTTSLVDDWVALWNGDLALADRIVGEPFVSHAAPITGGPAGDASGRASLREWVGGIHEAVRDLVFTIDVGPIREGDLVAVRWRADGVTALARPVRFFGTDTLRLQGGRIVEYWGNADSLWFVQQLGAVAVPSR